MCKIQGNKLQIFEPYNPVNFSLFYFEILYYFVNSCQNMDLGKCTYWHSLANIFYTFQRKGTQFCRDGDECFRNITFNKYEHLSHKMSVL